jgi:cation diffusion facilitator family transporter
VLLLKLWAWWITGSVGLLSDAMESLVNISAAIVAIIALRAASRPPSQKHQFGLGKAEYFSALVEGGMIVVAATMIIISAVQRLLDPQPLEQIGIGLAISVLASAINAAVAVILLRVGRQRGSMALVADAHHLFTDLWTTGGVVIGVLVVGLSGWIILDPLIAIGVAINIVVVGVRLLRRSTAGLMDSALPSDEVDVMKSVLAPYRGEDVVIHGVQTRQAGRQSFISMHVLVPGDWNVAAGHELCTQIEQDLCQALPGVQVMTHLEPLEDPRAWNDTHEGQHPLD